MFSLGSVLQASARVVSSLGQTQVKSNAKLRRLTCIEWSGMSERQTLTIAALVNANELEEEKEGGAVGSVLYGLAAGHWSTDMGDDGSAFYSGSLSDGLIFHLVIKTGLFQHEQPLGSADWITTVCIVLQRTSGMPLPGVFAVRRIAR